MSAVDGVTRGRIWVVASTGVLAALLFVACGGGSGDSARAPTSTLRPTGTAPTTSAAPQFRDVVPTASDFVNINTMTRVGDHFVGSLNGHLGAVLAVAHAPKDRAYPVGTVIQLIPTEAMVKRHAGYSPATNDWEFFQLSVSPQGTVIRSSGARVKNFFGGDCASCHAAAAARFDFVCEKNHGCAPLPFTAAQLASTQRGDPRPKR